MDREERNRVIRRLREDLEMYNRMEKMCRIEQHCPTCTCDHDFNQARWNASREVVLDQLRELSAEVNPFEEV